MVDLDELPEDGCILGVPVVGAAAESNWHSYEALWLKILGLITRAGQTVVVLCQIPSLEGGLPERTPQGVPMTWHLLDVFDDVQRRRLRMRGWPDDRVAEAVQAAQSARAVVASRITFGRDEPPAVIARRTMEMVTAARHS